MICLANILSQPMEVPTNIISLLWALPVCLSIALVHKAIKLPPFTAKFFIREVVLLFITIVGILIVAALGLQGILWLSNYWSS